MFTYECYIQFTVPVCCCLLGLGLSCSAFSIFLNMQDLLGYSGEYSGQCLSLFWVAVITLNIHLHKADIFVHSSIKEIVKFHCMEPV